MKSRVVARRYAEAFFQVIKEGNLDEAYAEFSSFMEAMHQSAELKGILKHPAINIERKTALLKKLLASARQPVVFDFLCLLLQRHRFIFIDLIAREVKDLYRQEKHIVRVQVRTAVPLLSEERQAIIERLNSQVQGSIELKEQVEPHIKGGMILRFAEKVLDASVQNRLKLLRERLCELKSELLSAVQILPGTPICSAPSPSPRVPPGLPPSPST